MTNQDSLEQLLARCAGGDRDAFERLYQATSAKLYGICLVLLKREDIAEDVLQDSFVKIWTRANTYSPDKGSALTWMTSVVRNRALDVIRSGRHQEQDLSDLDVELGVSSSDSDPVTSAEISVSTEAIMDCLNQLKEEQKHCIMMAYYHGHTHHELSKSLKTPLGTVKAWIRRGIERIRECLG